jgi:hypothetical protein
VRNGYIFVTLISVYHSSTHISLLYLIESLSSAYSGYHHILWLHLPHHLHKSAKLHQSTCS